MDYSFQHSFQDLDPRPSTEEEAGANIQNPCWKTSAKIPSQRFERTETGSDFSSCLLSISSQVTWGAEIGLTVLVSSDVDAPRAESSMPAPFCSDEAGGVGAGKLDRTMFRRKAGTLESSRGRCSASVTSDTGKLLNTRSTTPDPQK